MPTLKRICMKIFATAIVLFVSVVSILACTCSGIADIKTAFDDAHTVFIGRLLCTETKKGQSFTKCTFALISGLKGTFFYHQVEIYTGASIGNCGIPFRLGEEYIIYADTMLNHTFLSPRLYTGSCLRTQPNNPRELEAIKVLVTNK